MAGFQMGATYFLGKVFIFCWFYALFNFLVGGKLWSTTTVAIGILPPDVRLMNPVVVTADRQAEGWPVRQLGSRVSSGHLESDLSS